MTSSVVVGRAVRQHRIAALLGSLLHPDVIPLVMGFEVTLEFQLVQSLLGRDGRKDGEVEQIQGLALQHDEIFVLDAGNHRIQVFDQRTGHFLRKWGGFKAPLVATISFNAEGAAELFVMDRLLSGDMIQVFDISTSKLLCRFPIPGGGQRNSSGIVALNDHLFVSRADPSIIQVLSKADGKLIRVIGCYGTKRGEFDCPVGLFIDEHRHEVYVADAGNRRVQVLDAFSGQFLRGYGGVKQLRYPLGVVAHGEQVIVSDACMNRVVVFHQSTGVLLPSVDDQSQIGLDYPAYLAINHTHQLFVCNVDSNKILVFE